MNLDFLKELGLKEDNDGTSTGLTSHPNNAEQIASYSPVDGKLIGKASVTTKEQYEAVIETAQSAFKHWRTVPAPQRGEVVRQYGEALRKHKDALGRLVSYEMGKSLQEGFGEVQEMIDICDFATSPAPHVRAVAPNGYRRHHLCLQLPGGGVELEQHDRPCLRRRNRLETLRKGTDVWRCLPEHLGPGS